ncbi:MAG TPA: non-heme iron oxygenase ferredoxin subunit [Steroidobacteraceae bacterium]|nr:non-heme iron oxygenase ferredoxin subunit [Steroidobacteraceae bacterium]
MSESATRVRLCAVDDIEPGEMLQVALAGLPPLAVYRVGDEEFFCTQDMCTHGNASLAGEGDLEGYIVECSWHEGKFDIRTGQPCALPCTEPLKTFPVAVEDGEVFLKQA